MLALAGCSLARATALDESKGDSRFLAFKSCVDKEGVVVHPKELMQNMAHLLVGLKKITPDDSKKADNVIKSFLDTSCETIPLLKEKLVTLPTVTRWKLKEDIAVLESLGSAFTAETAQTARIVVQYFVNKRNPVRDLGNGAAHPAHLKGLSETMDRLLRRAPISDLDKNALKRLAHGIEMQHRRCNFGLLTQSKKERKSLKKLMLEPGVPATLGDTEVRSSEYEKNPKKAPIEGSRGSQASRPDSGPTPNESSMGGVDKEFVEGSSCPRLDDSVGTPTQSGGGEAVVDEGAGNEGSVDVPGKGKGKRKGGRRKAKEGEGEEKN